jgi:hypothetical protein
MLAYKMRRIATNISVPARYDQKCLYVCTIEFIEAALGGYYLLVTQFFDGRVGNKDMHAALMILSVRRFASNEKAMTSMRSGFW